MRTNILWLPLAFASTLLIACGDDTSGPTGGAGGTGGDTTTTGGGGNTTTTGGGGMGGGGMGGSADVCGDGVVADTEACDDSNTTPGDGCAANCEVETGYECAGQPSECNLICGNGVLDGNEACDDGNSTNIDGCSSMCTVEVGYDCTGAPSACTADCGDGVIAEGAETCDDSNTDALDGCSDICATESGWACVGEPSTCTTDCGDGLIAGVEVCDDMNMVDDDGCTACMVDDGFGCSGEPSVCEVAGTCSLPIIASNGFVFQAPSLNGFGDDLDNTDASCTQPSSLAGEQPDLVFQIDLVAGELLHIAESGTADVLFHVLDGACDSASMCLASYDGGGPSEINPGLQYTAATTGTYFVVIDSYTSNPPTTASLDLLFETITCGDGLVASLEACDDGGVADGDGCSATCTLETGFTCSGEPSVCGPVPGQSCADAIVATDGFTYTGSDIAGYVDNLDFPDASCSDVATANYDSPEIVFSVDLLNGDILKVTEFGSLDVVMHILPGACMDGSVCADSADFGETTTGVEYTATADGTYFVVVESYSAAPTASSTFDVRFSVATCGDGILSGAEACDDGDVMGGDGCSATCTVETGFMCTGEPSICTPLPGQSCGDAIVATDGFTYTGSNIAGYGDNLDFPDASCSDVATANYNSPEIVFSVDLLSGETVKVTEFGSLDVVMHILPGACMDGSVCADSADFGETTTGVEYTATADGTYFVVVESYSAAPTASSTFDIRFSVSICGDGVVSGDESCDDGGIMSGDGCSATCTLETGFACDNDMPSTCYDISACTDATCYLGPCTGTVVTATAMGLPANFVDFTVVPISIPVAGTGTIQKMVLAFDATHTFDGDIDLSLAEPGGALPGLNICSDNGGSNENFTGTFFKDGVSTAITAGSAPFTGVFRPEAPLASFNGIDINGTWTLSAGDDGTGDTGTVDAAELAFCVTP